MFYILQYLRSLVNYSNNNHIENHYNNNNRNYSVISSDFRKPDSYKNINTRVWVNNK